MKVFNPLAELTRRNIQEHGWHGVAVCPTVDGNENFPAFVYSVGFREHDEHPEMLIVGLPINLAHQLLWEFYRRIAAGERFAAGEIVSDILDDYDVLLRAVPADGRPLNAARAHYRLNELPALQVLWPDVAGNFPADLDGNGGGCAPQYEAAQSIETIRNAAG